MSRKKRKLTSKELEEKRLHAKLLERLGVSKTSNGIKSQSGSKSRRRPYTPDPQELKSRDVYPSLDTQHHQGTRLEDEKYKQEVSSKYVIGQAYNKSNFQVLSKREEKDDSTGKRR